MDGESAYQTEKVSEKPVEKKKRISTRGKIIVVAVFVIVAIIFMGYMMFVA